mgnify:CR=1 FL=1
MDNGNHSHCNMGILMIEKMEVMGSKLWVINFYREQLDKFDKLGLGKQTEHNVVVTPQLIAITNKRLEDLSVNYDRKLTPSAFKFRDRRNRLRQIIRIKANGQLKHDGAAQVKSRKDISDPGHEGSES